MAFSIRRGKKQDDVIVDRVTGAFNRRELDAVVAAGFDVSDQPTGTLLVLIDRFDEFSDRKGDITADQVLERVSWVIMATVRTTDVVYRHDTSSFCVLLPATIAKDAVSVADRVRSNVEKMPLLVDSKVTVSIGVATGISSDIASTIERAGSALNVGHLTGDNQVFVGDSSAAPADSPAPVVTQAVANAVTAPVVSPELATAFARPPQTAVQHPHVVPAGPPATVPLTPPSL